MHRPINPTEAGSHVAIVGAGASGALVAAQLLRRLGPNDSLTLIGDQPKVALGVAYGTTEPHHLLNVRATGMSAFPDEPCHFVDWLVAQGVGDVAGLQDAFIPRLIYGEYLQAVLEAAQDQSAATFQIIQAMAVGLKPTEAGVQVGLDTSECLEATHVVLASGHPGPKVPGFLRPIQGHPRVILAPWSAELKELAESGEEVLLVGTGLSMVDAALALDALQCKGKIHARSRRGLLPQPHRVFPKPPVTRIDGPVTDLRSLARQVISQARAAGCGWRGIIDGCRSQTTGWWQALSWSDRARFLRRLQPYWDVHRHRIAEKVHAILQQMQIEGRLDIGAAPTMRAQVEEYGFAVTTATETLSVGWIVNCTGPETDYRAAKVPVLESAVQSGLAEYDPLGMGLMVDQNHRTHPQANVFALGSLCRGCLWESVAVPELRVQAERIASAIAS